MGGLQHAWEEGPSEACKVFFFFSITYLSAFINRRHSQVSLNIHGVLDQAVYSLVECLWTFDLFAGSTSVRHSCSMLRRIVKWSWLAQRRLNEWMNEWMNACQVLLGPMQPHLSLDWCLWSENFTDSNYHCACRTASVLAVGASLQVIHIS